MALIDLICITLIGVRQVQRPGKIVATKGKSRVSKVTSGERGNNITLIYGVNAVGNYTPPMFLFPRVRMKAELMADSEGYATVNGWTDSGMFMNWLKMFRDVSQATRNHQQVGRVHTMIAELYTYMPALVTHR